MHPSVLIHLPRQQDPQYILERAASVLHVPLPALRDFARAHAHLDKRPRLNSDVPMSPPFFGGVPPRDEEKQAPVGPPEQDGPGGRRQFPVLPENSTLLEWGGSGVAECLASFCQPSSGYESDPGRSPAANLCPRWLTSGAGYSSVPVSAAYDYGGRRPFPATMTSPAQEHGHVPFAAAAGPAEPPTNLFACEDPVVVAQYMQAYPPLQPSRAAGDQPTTRREAMFYPDSVPNPHFYKAEDGGAAMAPPNLRADPPPMGGRPAFPVDVMPVADSPAVSRQSTVIGGAAPSYGMMAGYGASDSLMPDGRMGMQLKSPESNLDVVFPNQKAPPSKRGPFKDHRERQKTAQTRKIGSCIRCRMQRIRVSLRTGPPRSLRRRRRATAPDRGVVTSC